MERISEIKIREIYENAKTNRTLLDGMGCGDERALNVPERLLEAQLEADKAEHERVVGEMLKGIWDMFHTRGISVFGEARSVMEVTVSHKKEGRLTANVTFSRPAEDGILSWLPDNEWKDLKSKYEGK